MLRLRLLILDPSKRTSIDCCEDTLKIQLGGSREMPGPPREARDHCCQDPLTPHACLLQDPSFMSVKSWDKSWCELLFQRYIGQAWHECRRQTTHTCSLLSQRDHLVLAWVTRWRTGDRCGLNPGAELPPSCESHRLLPILS